VEPTTTTTTTTTTTKAPNPIDPCDIYKPYALGLIECFGKWYDPVNEELHLYLSFNSSDTNKLLDLYLFKIGSDGQSYWWNQATGFDSVPTGSAGLPTAFRIFKLTENSLRDDEFYAGSSWTELVIPKWQIDLSTDLYLTWGNNAANAVGSSAIELHCNRGKASDKGSMKLDYAECDIWNYTAPMSLATTRVIKIEQQGKVTLRINFERTVSVGGLDFTDMAVEYDVYLFFSTQPNSSYGFEDVTPADNWMFYSIMPF
jgi:hypothetical protein